MGKKLDALLGRKGFKTSKLKTLLGLTVSRLAILKNQRRVRCTQARSDIAQLLRNGHQERPFHRAEYVIKEQNMLDVFVMVESFCNILMERSSLLEHSKVCPDELNEAISSLIFVASRSADLPELRDVRSLFASRFGQDFVASAVEVRNGCAVNAKIIQKMSTRQPAPESIRKVIKDVADENGIPFNIEEPSSEIEKEEVIMSQSNSQPTSAPVPQPPVVDSNPSTVVNSPEPSSYYWKEELSESMKVKEKFKDATSAAQAAFESAAFAAAAARAAVDLSRAESHGKGSGDQSSPRPVRRTVSEEYNKKQNEDIPHKANQSVFEKIHHESEHEQELNSDDSRKKNPIINILLNDSDDESSDEVELDHRRGRAPSSTSGTGHGFQRHMGLEKASEEEEETANTINNEGFKFNPPYQIRTPMRSKGNPVDALDEEMNTVGLRLRNEGNNNNNWRDHVVADSRGKSFSPRSPLGSYASFSVRTRRSGI